MNKLIFICVFCFTASVSFAETWGPFSSLINDSDFIAQYQELVREEKLIGKRYVAIYWEKDRLKKPGYLSHEKPWSLKEYHRKTDILKTKFVFYGRGQHLWTAEPENGAILFPGKTAHRTPGEEIACSVVEFHEILKQVAKLKREGKPVKKALTVSVFGKQQKSK